MVEFVLGEAEKEPCPGGKFVGLAQKKSATLTINNWRALNSWRQSESGIFGTVNALVKRSGSAGADLNLRSRGNIRPLWPSLVITGDPETARFSPYNRKSTILHPRRISGLTPNADNARRLTRKFNVQCFEAKNTPHCPAEAGYIM
jgi:hypothetical protein